MSGLNELYKESNVFANREIWVGKEDGNGYEASRWRSISLKAYIKLLLSAKVLVFALRPHL